ncbi:YtxH domain-containing protein [Cyanobacteria bacterium FACHB-DQ100]|uniref:hypothetical protein n=1 Tax=Leptolyngbya sp. DQ-M1 TaxID=2933920 RepID=UPI0019C20B89|nr:YtxH domain-containing protein [Cyanobacteria bacterium FACHB-DQ100]
MTNSNQFLTTETPPVNSSSYSSASPPGSGNGLTKIVIGASIGAILGGFAASLLTPEVTERFNRSIRNVGGTAKSTADTLNDAVQQIGDSVNSVAENIDGSTKDVNEAVNSVTTNVSHTVRSTVSTVRQTADGVNETVRTVINAVNAVKAIANDVQAPAQRVVNMPTASPTAPTGDTLYKLVPVNEDPK